MSEEETLDTAPKSLLAKDEPVDTSDPKNLLCDTQDRCASTDHKKASQDKHTSLPSTASASFQDTKGLFEQGLQMEKNPGKKPGKSGNKLKQESFFVRFHSDFVKRIDLKQGIVVVTPQALLQDTKT